LRWQLQGAAQVLRRLGEALLLHQQQPQILVGPAEVGELVESAAVGAPGELHLAGLEAQVGQDEVEGRAALGPDLLLEPGGRRLGVGLHEGEHLAQPLALDLPDLGLGAGEDAVAGQEALAPLGVVEHRGPLPGLLLGPGGCRLETDQKEGCEDENELGGHGPLGVKIS